MNTIRCKECGSSKKSIKHKRECMGVVVLRHYANVSKDRSRHHILYVQRRRRFL